MKNHRALWTGFARSAEMFPDRPAVIAEGKTLTSKELCERACRIAATIQGHQDSITKPLTAVFAYRNLTAFAGVLGSLLAGNGYVPLNRTFPLDRTQVMFERSECSSLVVDTESLPQLNKILEESRKALLVVLPEYGECGITPGTMAQTYFCRFERLGSVTQSGKNPRRVQTRSHTCYSLQAVQGLPKV